MLGWDDECSVRDVLVFFSLDDNAPQRMRIRVQKNLSSEEILRQITLQLSERDIAKHSALAPHVSLPLDAQLFAFCVKENCFVPIDGKSANTLKDFTRLLIHPAGCSPPQNGVIPRASSAPGGASRWRSSHSPSCRPSTGRPFSCQTRERSLPLQFSRPRASRLDDVGSGRGGDVGDDDADSELAAANKSSSFTLKLMLQVTEFLLSEYSARAVDDVIEPTWENLQILVENILSRNYSSAPCSLDALTVEAFMETFLRGLRLGRMCRTSPQLPSLKENITDM